jgi:hypothetical protein
MPYGVLAFALAGALPALLVLAAVGANVYWVCLLIESNRLLAPDSRLQDDHGDFVLVPKPEA